MAIRKCRSAGGDGSRDRASTAPAAQAEGSASDDRTLDWRFVGGAFFVARLRERLCRPAVLRRRRVAAGGTAEAVARILDETLDDLHDERDPRRAVIAAYARMERALAVHGLARRQPEAPLEYLERGSRSCTRARRRRRWLTRLFERASFSNHPVEPGMKEEAIEALEVVRGGADGSVRRMSRVADRPIGAPRSRLPSLLLAGFRRAAAGSPSTSSLPSAAWRPGAVLALARALAYGSEGHRRAAAGARGGSCSGSRSSSAPERAVLLAASNAFDVHYRLRPSSARSPRTGSPGAGCGSTAARAVREALGDEVVGARPPRPRAAGRRFGRGRAARRPRQARRPAGENLER